MALYSYNLGVNSANGAKPASRAGTSMGVINNNIIKNFNIIRKTFLFK